MKDGRKFVQRARGFTLIEILIVLALLAILAAVVIPNLVGYIGRGEARSYEADKKNIQGAVDAYYSDPGNRVAGKKTYSIKGGTGNTNRYDGGTPVWDDMGVTPNLLRDVTEDWKTVSSVDTESYFINFETLVTGNYITAHPASSSLDNKPTASTLTYGGSYSWFVDGDGDVESIYYYNPIGTGKTGFQTGIYP